MVSIPRLPSPAHILKSAATAVPLPVLAASVRAAFALPAPARRALGSPRSVDGRELSLDSQTVLSLLRMQGVDGLLGDETVAEARAGTVRLSRAVGGRPDPRMVVRSVTVDGADGPLPARLFTPAALPAMSPLIVYFHGGGFVVGDLDSHDAPCRLLAEATGARVLSVDYRLAPEHPFPAAPLDAVAATASAIRDAEQLGADPAAVIVSGDSAGGNLAAVVSREMTLAGGPKPAAALLFYPVTGDDPANLSRHEFASGYFLTLTDIERFDSLYLPDPADRTDPRYDVLHADAPADLPPTHVVTAGFDPLRDEGLAYAERLRAAGVPVTSVTVDGAIHGFVNMIGVSEEARHAVIAGATAVRALLSDSGGDALKA
ncbi:alpha/beta hydrolase [Tsukamurella soli]|uniref:Alpha/beta hydrolase n=1 Tax=Tsukamurella soli TaxID=644556 RepID=A0ABP8KB21_9ACTN